MYKKLLVIITLLFCAEAQSIISIEKEAVSIDLVDISNQYHLVDFGAINVDFPLTTNSYEDKLRWESVNVDGFGKGLYFTVSKDAQKNALDLYELLNESLDEKKYEKHIDCFGKRRKCGFYFPVHLLSEPKVDFYRKIERIEQLHAQNFIMFSGIFSVDEFRKYYLIFLIDESNDTESLRVTIDIMSAKDWSLSVREKSQPKYSTSEIFAELKKEFVKGVKFDPGSFQINSGSAPVLAKVAAFIAGNDGWKYTISGFSDSSGDSDFNEKLSLRRAQAVLKVLVDDYGISENLLTPIGFGENEPLSDNSTEIGRSKNRRVELTWQKAP